MDTEADKDWSQLVDHAFSHFVEPSLIEPTIVHDYPVELSPFARTTDDDPSLTERFEYFAGGMELGNAYSEINDAETQQLRFDEQAEHVEGDARRSRLRRGALVRHAADRRPRARHRPADDAADGPRDDPRRRAVPGASGAEALRRACARLACEAITSSRMSSSERFGSQPIAARIFSIDGSRWSIVLDRPCA